MSSQGLDLDKPTNEVQIMTVRFNDQNGTSKPALFNQTTQKFLGSIFSLAKGRRSRPATDTVNTPVHLNPESQRVVLWLGSVIVISALEVYLVAKYGVTIPLSLPIVFSLPIK